MQLRARPAFTLLELAVAVTIVLAVISFSYPRIANLRHTTYKDAVANDLRNLVHQQELLFNAESRYTEDLTEDALNFTLSDKVNVTVQYLLADNSWLATGEYISMPTATCAVAMGAFTPVGYTGSKVECAEDF